MPNIFETTDAAANNSTTYSLTAGQTAQGTLASNGDHDWYRVDLVAGQTYTFAMVGTAANNVRDTYLRLYAPGGTTIVAQDDNGLQGANSVFTYTATSTGSYYIDAGALNNAGTGQYGVSFTVGNRASFDVTMGAGVIDTDLSWSATAGTGVNVTYGYRSTNNGAEATFQRVTDAQIAATEQIIQMFAEVCGLTFTRINTVEAKFTNDATILFSRYQANDGSGAYAYYPTNGGTAAANYAGDVWLNTSVSSTSLPIGSYSYSTIAHELGHAVGLSHPGKYNAAPGVSITYGANAQFSQDTEQYTLMSYFDESNTTGSYGSDPDTLMLFDVLALQNIYGANTNTRNTDTVYGFGSTAGVAAYNFQTNTNPAVCIWDGGGTDTLNVSGFNQNQIINLNAGTFSNIGGLTGNVSIAYNCTIENATSGNGADRFFLSADNVNNLIVGGGGSDTVNVTYTYGAGYTVSGTTANFTLSGAAGTDTFQSVEFIIFASGQQVSAVDLLASAPIVNYVTISDVTITEGNAGTKVATFTVTRTGGTSAFNVSYSTANGTASSGSDYLGVTNGVVNFGVNENTKTISITINGDTAVEQNETFSVNLSNATGGAIITDTQGLGTITDDDAAAVIGSVSVGDVVITEGNAGTQTVSFAVTRTGGTAAFTVNYATANGTAASGTDYAPTSGTLSFAAGVNSQNVTVTVLGDTAVEANETFFLNLTSLTAGGTLADAQGLATIFDNDGSGDDFRDSFTDTSVPFGSVSIGGTATGNLETIGDHDWFAITLAAGSTVTIDLEGLDTTQGTLEDPYLRLYGSAGQLLVQNDDGGTGVNSQLVYTPGASGTFYIDAGSYNNEGAGTYRINVAGVPIATGSVTISDVTIVEGNGGTQTAIFTVARTGGTGAFSVNFATANDSAAAGSDYVATSGTLNFGAGVNTQTIAVTINGDIVDENNEAFFVNLSAATNGATITDSQGIGTIVDNDDALNPDDFADNLSDLSAPFGNVNAGGSATGNLEANGDRDWFHVSLVAGQLYTFRLEGISVLAGTLTDPYLYLYNSTGQQIAFNDDGAGLFNSRISYRATATGTYYIAAAGYNDNHTGTYTASVILADDYAGDASTSAALLPGGTAEGNLELLGDKDWFRVQLTAGYTYTFDMLGLDSAAGTLADPYLSIYDSFGKKVLAKDDDSGNGSNAQLSVVANTSGVYYVAASAFNNAFTGTYDLTMTKSPGVDILGTNFRDVIDDISGVNGVFPTAFADIINGRGGDDDIFGGDGEDTLIGGKGIDYLYGEEGSDIIVATAKDDQFDLFDGGSGTDTLRVSGTANLVQNGFDATAFSIEIWQGNNKAVQGTAFAETFDFSGLTAITGILYVDALAGDDVMIGSNLADTFRGGTGNDIINGRLGNDMLSGGSNNDRFVFEGSFGHDTITDFTPGNGVADVIDFQPGVFASFGAVQAAMSIVDGDGDGRVDDTRITTVNGTVTVLNKLNTLFVADDFDLV